MRGVDLDNSTTQAHSEREAQILPRWLLQWRCQYLQLETRRAAQSGPAPRGLSHHRRPLLQVGCYRRQICRHLQRDARSLANCLARLR